LDGSDATPLLEGRAFDRDRPLYWHYYRALGDPKAALREGRWMILASRVGPPALGRNINERSMAAIKGERLERFELYDLSRDPAQQQDLAAVHPELLERLKRRLLERHAEVREEGVRWEFP
ncbi:MAG: arylsulfatase, partial [Planctomycetota bacterium]